MAVETSRLSQYEVGGIAEDTDCIVSRLSLYVVEGGNRLLYGSRLSQYVVEGPPPVISDAPRRRQVHLP